MNDQQVQHLIKVVDGVDAGGASENIGNETVDNTDLNDDIM